MALNSKECECPVDKMAPKPRWNGVRQTISSLNRRSKLLEWEVVNPRQEPLPPGGWKFCPVYGTYERC